ncbi:MAG: thiamine pyrophosphate-dependent enzyme, partial [Oligoflexia bacterium]|nr:thiamine pyrophosphate-dependent enzyme [Oligoflexia bacterium]
METAVKQVFDKSNYQGASPSTLCLGCGHDQISKHIIQAFYQAGVNPFSIAKISGIGCSSKTPNYFLKQSRGLNGIHGRMASLATGVKIANRNLKVIGVSGDGDTGSIGLGSFLHTVRKNIPMIYIVENNGVYGLTKGQFSATAQKDSFLKKRQNNPFYQMDLCRLALSAGCGFVARSFSGDNKQLIQLLKLALKYEGLAFIDVISPCVAYGNEKDFPHSFNSMKENKFPLNELDIIVETSAREEEISEGEVK